MSALRTSVGAIRIARSVACATAVSLALTACSDQRAQPQEVEVTTEPGSTLARVRARAPDGEVLCQVGTGTRGFYEAGNDADGGWRGFDVDICRAVAAAVLGDADAVRFVSTTAASRFSNLTHVPSTQQLGEAPDLLSRTTTWTMSRDTSFGINFPVVTFYDGQQFMVPADTDPTMPLRDYLKGRTVCVQDGTTTLLNLLDYSERYDLDVVPKPHEDSHARDDAYKAGQCDALTNDGASLRATLATMSDEERQRHVIVDQRISREPLGPAVREGDDQWADIVRWTVLAMIAAEINGVSQANVDQARDNSRIAEVQRLLGTDGALHDALGLESDWAYDVIKQVGNYGDVYARNLTGEGTLDIPRQGTENALWDPDAVDGGGMMYAPPFR